MASNTAKCGSAKCSLCSELFVDPRMLQCLHSFCIKCLKKTLEEQGSGTSVKCPTCEKIVSLPEGGIDALPKDLRKAYEVEIAQYESKLTSEEHVSCDQCIDASNGPAVSFCINCCEFLCEACTKHHKTWRKTVNHELELMDSSKSKEKSLVGRVGIPHQPVHCQLHHDEILKFYCETCGVLTCRDCIVLKHIGHEYERTEIVAEKQKAELSSVIKDAEGAIAKLDDVMTHGGKVMQQVQAGQKSIEEDIRNVFKVLREALAGREEALLGKIAETGLGKLTALTIQGEELKAMRDELADICETVTAAMKTYAPLEMISAKGPMAARLQQLLKCHEIVSLEPCRSTMMLSLLDPTVTDFIQKINSFGTVGSSCPDKAEANLYIPRALVSKKKQITISTCDIHGKQWPCGGERVEVKLSLMGSNDPPMKASIVDNNNGTYLASFVPKVCGEHELSITVENQPIRYSPVHIYVRQERKYQECTTRLQTFSTSGCPSGVAVDDCNTRRAT